VWSRRRQDEGVVKATWVCSLNYIGQNFMQLEMLSKAIPGMRLPAAPSFIRHPSSFRIRIPPALHAIQKFLQSSCGSCCKFEQHPWWQKERNGKGGRMGWKGGVQTGILMKLPYILGAGFRWVALLLAGAAPCNSII